MNMLLDLAKMITQYTVEPVWKFHEWIPMNRQDWASRFDDQTQIAINGCESNETNALKNQPESFKQLVTYSRDMKRNYWAFLLVDKSSINKLKTIIETITHEINSGEITADSEFYAYPDIKSEPAYNILITKYPHLGWVDIISTNANILRKAQELDI